MTPPFLLIAEREFRAYVATASFWVALVVGPAAVGLALGIAALAVHPAPPTSVAVLTPDPAMRRSTEAALIQAARIEGRPISIRMPKPGGGATARVVVSPGADGGGMLSFEGPVPLSASGRALAAATVARDAWARRTGTPAPPPWRVAGSSTQPRRPLDAGPMTRFGLVMMLWLTLTGSLGMLLNAVVRERANRALEMLLGAARPADIVFGKLIGVGAVSLLVLSVWLAAAGLAPLVPGAVGPTASILAAVGNPATLARAGFIYIAGYLFYGLLTIALGAAARDSAQAQNMSRPMFAVLLAAFFASLASAAGAAGPLRWLVWAPPFTPFMLLLQPPTALGPVQQAAAIGSLAVTAALCALVAMRRLRIGPSRQAA